jgi:hypothetical protein
MREQAAPSSRIALRSPLSGGRSAPSWLQSAIALDRIRQIRLFVKLKLTKCARPGNRAGFFRACSAR